MGKKDGWVIHIQKSRSWWSGSITALCGSTSAAGQWDRPGLFGAGAKCQECQRLQRRGR